MLSTVTLTETSLCKPPTTTTTVYEKTYSSANGIVTAYDDYCLPETKFVDNVYCYACTPTVLTYVPKGPLVNDSHTYVWGLYQEISFSVSIAFDITIEKPIAVTKFENADAIQTTLSSVALMPVIPLSSNQASISSEISTSPSSILATTSTFSNISVGEGAIIGVASATAVESTTVQERPTAYITSNDIRNGDLTTIVESFKEMAVSSSVEISSFAQLSSSYAESSPALTSLISSSVVQNDISSSYPPTSIPKVDSSSMDAVIVAPEYSLDPGPDRIPQSEMVDDIIKSMIDGLIIATHLPVVSIDPGEHNDDTVSDGLVGDNELDTGIVDSSEDESWSDIVQDVDDEESVIDLENPDLLGDDYAEEWSDLNEDGSAVDGVVSTDDLVPDTTGIAETDFGSESGTNISGLVGEDMSWTVSRLEDYSGDTEVTIDKADK
ncbi:hypothetical protein CANCADRAFT_144947 [Tortispora caseinolytica NRRL Y-17796]|uniref:Uncharacterized protein n=1 Tax=Tortispora caseinolytica NRRL Y-17796 TaxID=767744 RepID=A0A1E4T9B9_9ASCO|nr:hypothetical protein CANCADRAFT_144947 [Tortispora caseinolytica NRRL Y-17796]